MDRSTLITATHADHPIASPLNDATVEHLLSRAVRDRTARLLDLGCGGGTWLLRALAAHEGVTAVGVDKTTAGFDGVRAEAARLGVGDRLDLRCEDVTTHRSTTRADVVLNVGAAYAYGSLASALAACRDHLADGGTLVYGDCFWEREPDAAVRAVIEDGPQTFTDLPTTVATVVAEGWTPVYGHVSTPQEWDEYEWCWTGSLARWALDHPEHPDRDEALALAAEHRAEWLGGYRGVLGFVVLLLRRTPTPSRRTPARPSATAVD
jgi:SAM-dependent methyltransferase